jgi:hypothetical protein
MRTGKKIANGLMVAVVAMGIVGLMVGVANASWTPADIPNIVLWLDADDTGTITDTAGAVSQWNDKSGNANHVTATSTQEPITGSSTIGGLNVLLFDGSNDIMANSSFAMSTANMSVFVVRRQVSETSSRTWNIGKNSDEQGAVREGSNGSGTRVYGYRWPDNGGVGLTGDLLSHVTCYVKTGTALEEAYIDGTLEGTKTATLTTFTSEQMSIGAGGGYEANVEFAEMVVVSSALSTADRQKVEGYLAWKWGLEGNLPADHPYKTAAPGGAAATPGTLIYGK